jgi:preprotein translocase subunit SecA
MSIATPPTEPAPPTPVSADRIHNVEGRLGPRLLNHLRRWTGWPWEMRLARAALQLQQIRAFEKKYRTLTDAEMLECGLRLRGRARGGENLARLLPEAFGLVSVAAQRLLNLKPHDVQLAAGVVLHHGALAELATGEGKTLCAAFPVYLNGLQGKGVHVATVNDYLARRDAEELMGPLYRALGLSCGVLQQQMGDQDRTRAYRCDITYGTASEFGFDFLRDRLKVAGNRGREAPFWGPWLRSGAPAGSADVMTQREEHHFALVDEADNIFIDEARTPLIISNPTRAASPSEQVVYRWADRVARQMKPQEHFVLDAKKQKLELTLAGRQLMRWSNPPMGPKSHAMDKLEEHIERALQAHHRMRRDQHYMIDNDKILIIDESTGRRMPDRHWRDGLHQAVETKESVTITVASDHAAQITYQSYFRLYKKLSGMTGTAAQNWWEIRRVYKLWVVCVPTNMPCIREQWPDRVFPTEEAKFNAVVEEVKRLQALGRPVLIGTRSVEKSEALSRKLKAAGIEHQVLNARFHEQEAKIIAHAGEKGKVTIATNMAGRGTDIKPSLEVIAAGGLHVLGTERHEALRIDRQLLGRAGRQGDPGTCQFFMSLEDELLEGLGEDAKEHMAETGRQGSNRNWQRYQSSFVKAQKKLEKRHYRNRVDLMVYEKRRQEVLKDLGADPYVD